MWPSNVESAITTVSYLHERLTLIEWLQIQDAKSSFLKSAHCINQTLW